MAARSALQVSYWAATTTTVLLAAVIMAFDVPVESNLGAGHRLLAVYLPLSIATVLTGAVLFIACSGYLWHRTVRWDHLASSAGHIAMLISSVMLLTAMVCERIELGRWWTWSPRLMFSMVLCTLFVTYLGIRLVIASPDCRAMVSAVYGLAACLNIPLIYLLVGLAPDVHSTSILAVPPVRITSLAWGVPIALVAGGLIWRGYRALEARS